MKNFEDNIGAADVQLSDSEVKHLREIAEKAEVAGERYDARAMSYAFVDAAPLKE